MVDRILRSNSIANTLLQARRKWSSMFTKDDRDQSFRSAAKADERRPVARSLYLLFRLKRICDNISGIFGDIAIHSGHVATIGVDTIEKPKPAAEDEWNRYHHDDID